MKRLFRFHGEKYCQQYLFFILYTKKFRAVDQKEQRFLCASPTMLKSFADSCLCTPEQLQDAHNHYLREENSDDDPVEVLRDLHARAKIDPLNGKN